MLWHSFIWYSLKVFTMLKQQQQKKKNRLHVKKESTIQQNSGHFDKK